jgi:hypothetical protein
VQVDTIKARLQDFNRRNFAIADQFSQAGYGFNTQISHGFPSKG